MMDEAEPRTGRAGARGAAGRVAEVQRQCRPTMVCAASFLVAAAIAGAVPHDTGSWLPLHLALAGGLVLAVSGATQFLAVTWGAAPAPRRWLVAVQRWTVVIGVALVASGREGGIDAVTAAGGTAVAAGLILLGVLLVGIARGAIQPRVRPAVVAYVVGVALGVVGVALGAVMGGGGGGRWFVRLREVHATLNLLGLAGFVIAGTLPFFVATQAKTKMSRRASLGAQFGVQVVMLVGITVTVAGLLARAPLTAAVGLVSYDISLVFLVTLLPRLGRKQLQWAGPRLLQAGTAIAWWIGAIALAAGHAAAGRSPFSGAALPALVIGGYAQLLVASLSYLGPVLVGGGAQRLAASFRVTRSWIGLIAGNVAAVAACAMFSWPVYAVALTVWVVDGVVRASLLLASRARVLAVAREAATAAVELDPVTEPGR
jgi:nitrite reductase (NO-forming)